MAPVGGEFGEGYQTEILGELLEQLDLSNILGHDTDIGVDRTQERVDEAIERALIARNLQSQVLDHAPAFNPAEFARLGSFTTAHVAEFVKRAAPFSEIEVEASSSSPERFRLRLPDKLKGQFPELGGRLVIEATTSRRLWSRTGSLTLLDFGSSFFRFLIGAATSPDFGGGYAAISSDIVQGSMAAAFLCRWQNDQGELLDQQLVILRKGTDGTFEIDNQIISRLLAGSVHTLTPPEAEPSTRKGILEAVRDRAEVDMAASVTRFRHPNDLIMLAVGEAGAQTDTVHENPSPIELAHAQ